MWHSCVITWDGKVVPCCFDKDAHHTLGDLTQNSFSEIWNGSPIINSGLRCCGQEVKLKFVKTVLKGLKSGLRGRLDFLFFYLLFNLCEINRTTFATSRGTTGFGLKAL